MLGHAGLGEDSARRLFGNLAYRSEALASKLAGEEIYLVTEPSRQSGKRQQVEVAFSALKRTFGIEHTLAKTLIGLATRIVAKIAAYTYAFLVNRLLDRPKGRIKELWA